MPFFKPRTQRPSINLKQQELEEELAFEEQLEEAAEAIIEESDNVDQEMLDEMSQIKLNIQKIKEQIDALKRAQEAELDEEVIDFTEEAEVATTTVPAEIITNVVTEEDIKTTTEKLISNTSISLEGTTIPPANDVSDSTSTEKPRDPTTT